MPELPVLLPGLLAVGLMLVWAVHDGGYDADTWYWGALVMLGLLSAVVIGQGLVTSQLPRGLLVAIGAFALYVCWSYLSIAWAGSSGDALDGANRALLYLLVFTLLALLPWTATRALMALLALVIGVGVIAIVLLFRLATTDHVASLVISGRLSSPTGYFNATAALFTMSSVAAVLLSIRRELPAIVRGALIGFACAGLQLALIVQSRGWLFTLPLVVVCSVALSRDRLRVVAASLLPAAAVLAPLHRLLAVFQPERGQALEHAAHRAGVVALVMCAAMFAGATLIAWGESRAAIPSLTATRRRAVGLAVGLVALLGSAAGAVAATHGHPFRFVSREWRGFTHPPRVSDVSSHFSTVGSGRYDFWRVSLDAFTSHPIGGLGQDNFADYYVSRRHTDEEPRWTHSFELRLLTQTGIVGFTLFAAFLIAALRLALRAVRRGAGLTAAVAASSLAPLVVWLIHGSVDWFWEFPALTAPALGFLAVAAHLGSPPPIAAPDLEPPPRSRRGILASQRWAPVVAGISGVLVVAAAVVALGFPYLSVREVSTASNVRPHDPARALRDLSNAADLNPLNAEPGRIAGVVALQVGQWKEAEQRFRQSISREPGGWLAWLGDGLAASALGDKTRAQRDFQVASSINKRDAVIKQALRRVYTGNPLTPVQALKMLFAA